MSRHLYLGAKSRDKVKTVSHFIQGPKFTSTLQTTCLGLLFFNYAEKYKDSICQISAIDNKTETYNSVKLRSVRLALEMEKKGVTYRDVIAVCSDNTMDNVIPIISAMYIGAKVVNIDHTLHNKQMKQLLLLTSPTVIFVEDTTYYTMKEIVKETNLKTEIIVLGTLRPYRDETTYSPSRVDVHETAILFFSSGSSGMPKASCHSHYSLMRIVQTIWNCGLYSRNVLHFTNFCWITFILITICAFLNGSTRIFCREAKDGAQIMKYVEQYQVATILMVPMNSYCLTNQSSTKRNIMSLENIIFTGHMVTHCQLKALRKEFVGVNIICNYGLTEVGLVTTFNPRIDSGLIKTKLGSCGKVVPEAKIKVVDLDTDETVLEDQVGEVRIKSPGLMKGYHSLDCAEFFDSEGFLKSGDIGYYDKDHCFYILDKIREVFKYRGHLIVPSTIEDVLLEHPMVKEAGVFGVSLKEEKEVPAACIVLKEKRHTTEMDVEQFVAERVASHEKLRGGIKIVQAIPKSSMGRCLRRELKNLYIEKRRDSISAALMLENP